MNCESNYEYIIRSFCFSRGYQYNVGHRLHFRICLQGAQTEAGVYQNL